MQHPYLKLGALVALVFWLIDSSLHYFAYSEESFEFIPSDIDELWMRILICVILVAFGWYVDYARQTSERDLRASESYFRGLVESSTEIVWRINTEGILTYISPSVKQVLDYEPNELLGLRFELQLADPESRQKVLRLLTQRRLGDLGSEPIVYELQYLHRDGTSITTEIRSAPIMAENGEIVEEQGISRDITERSRIKEELQKMAKLESIGVLAAGIAHDLNNFLTGIVGNIALARLDDDPIARDDKLELALNNAMRIKDLTAQLLTFAKGGSPMIQPHEIGDLLKRSVDFALSGSNLVCEYTIRDDLQLVKIDEAQIRQVINCLIINAIEAMPSGGSIKVSAEMTELDSEHSVPLDPGSYVRISIEDSGVGIPEENRKQVFDPFFTTKPTGSGLGLATSLSIIQKHKGSITLASEVGTGTRFDIYLPGCNKEILNQEDDHENELIKGEGSILVMDDESSIRDLASNSLSELGYEVVTCSDGAEAIEKYKQAMLSGKQFNLVILDLTIPGGMGGRATVEGLSEVDPNVKAIVVSGYSNDTLVSDFKDYGFKAVITKPYQLSELSQVVSEISSEH